MTLTDLNRMHCIHNSKKLEISDMSEPSTTSHVSTTIKTLDVIKHIKNLLPQLGSWVQKEQEWSQTYYDDMKADPWFEAWDKLKLKIEGVLFREKARLAYDGVKYTAERGPVQDRLIEFLSDLQPVGFLMNYKLMDSNSLDEYHRFLKSVIEEFYEIEIKPVCIKFYGEEDDNSCESYVYPLDNKNIEAAAQGIKSNKKREFTSKEKEEIKFVGSENDCFLSWSDEDADGHNKEYKGYAMICRPKSTTSKEEDADDGQNKKKQKQ
jgi:hypothetical protein